MVSGVRAEGRAQPVGPAVTRSRSVGHRWSRLPTRALVHQSEVASRSTSARKARTSETNRSNSSMCGRCPLRSNRSTRTGQPRARHCSTRPSVREAGTIRSRSPRTTSVGTVRSSGGVGCASARLAAVTRQSAESQPSRLTAAALCALASAGGGPAQTTRWARRSASGLTMRRIERPTAETTGVRTSGARSGARGLSHAGATRMSAETRSGAARARSAARPPPIEWPSTWHRWMSR